MRALHRGGVALGVMVALTTPGTGLAATTSTTFTTPGENAFVVPPAVTSLQMTLVGGRGGAGGNEPAAITGGAGATVVATLTVVPGEKLYAEVGGDGGAGDNAGNGLGGFNGGGFGGNDFILFAGGPSGGGGGGASDVRTVRACAPTDPLCPASLASRLVVAGGGGGAGGGFGGSIGGGPGGAADAAGTDGGHDLHSDANGTGGARGTQSGGGAAGTGPNKNATAGAAGRGGDGGANDIGGGGGGGGGGVNGGGGGGDATGQIAGSGPGTTIFGSGGGGGGGGASSLPPGPPGVSNLSLIPTVTGAEPQITFTWTTPPPAAITLPSFNVTAHSATLAGTVNPDASPVTGCSFTITPAPPGGPTLSCAQQLQPGSAPVPVSAQLAGLRPSTRYTVQLIATNAQGTSTGAPISFTTWPPPPTISQLRVANTVHRGSVRHPKQVTVALHLSQPAKVLVKFARLKGRKWVSLSYVLAPTLRAGADTVRFSSGRLGLGRYRMYVSATNAYGEISTVQRTAFTIVR